MIPYIRKKPNSVPILLDCFIHYFPLHWMSEQPNRHIKVGSIKELWSSDDKVTGTIGWKFVDNTYFAIERCHFSFDSENSARRKLKNSQQPFRSSRSQEKKSILPWKTFLRNLLWNQSFFCYGLLWTIWPFERITTSIISSTSFF